MCFSAKSLLLACTTLALSLNVQANMIDLGGGAIYDTALNITLTQDVRYDEIDLLSGSRMGLQGAVVTNMDGTYHIVAPSDLYQLSNTGAFRVGGTWWGATAWANTLTYGDMAGWRLPSALELENILNDPD